MATIEQTPKAFGAPGIPPRWTRGAKEAVGTAYSTSRQVWFTVSGGILIYSRMIGSDLGHRKVCSDELHVCVRRCTGQRA